MKRCALLMMSPTYCRALLRRLRESIFCPILWISAIRTRQRGHGQTPLSRTDARSTLESEFSTTTDQFLIDEMLTFPGNLLNK